MSKSIRRPRPRPTPKWLAQGSELDQLAQRRCLMLLSVLSGEKPVTEAIAEAEISRQLYYQLETKALQAMLRALTPGAESESASSGSSRVAELEARVTKLEREKRRAERLLFLTRKTLQPGGLKTRAGRPRTSTSRTMPMKSPRSPLSTWSGSAGSEAHPVRTTARSESPSTPTRAGAAAPSSGTES